MGSSISLTLWAFLGMESAAQNSDAVENPKRDVPLACLFGTLGAAVIYVLSTTVIQGIVPNAELANSTGPFALAYAQMFNPTIGYIIMGLAVLACLGSLLGWQFTIASTGKAAAEDGCSLVLHEGEQHGRADRRHDHARRRANAARAHDDLAVAQRAVQRARQSGRRDERHPVHRLAVRTIRDDEDRESPRFERLHRNAVITVVGMAYSVFAIYASGMDAVMGGTLVLGITYIVWGFIAPRFAIPDRFR